MPMTMAFTTVLPAVFGTAQWLGTFPRISAGLDRFNGFALPVSAKLPWLLPGLGYVALAATAVWPENLFCTLWLVPLLVIPGLQLFFEKPSLLVAITAGDWRHPWLLASAGLFCGVFWEMWNSRSVAHWVYTVPYLQRFEIFAMPLAGYAGYLPFGIICGLFADYLFKQQNFL